MNNNEWLQCWQHHVEHLYGDDGYCWAEDDPGVVCGCQSTHPNGLCDWHSYDLVGHHPPVHFDDQTEDTS